MISQVRKKKWMHLFLKTQNKKGKKYGETDLLKNKDYYPPQP